MVPGVGRRGPRVRRVSDDTPIQSCRLGATWTTLRGVVGLARSAAGLQGQDGGPPGRTDLGLRALLCNPSLGLGLPGLQRHGERLGVLLCARAHVCVRACVKAHTLTPAGRRKPARPELRGGQSRSRGVGRPGQLRPAHLPCV